MCSRPHEIMRDDSKEHAGCRVQGAAQLVAGHTALPHFISPDSLTTAGYPAKVFLLEAADIEYGRMSALFLEETNLWS